MLKQELVLELQIKVSWIYGVIKITFFSIWFIETELVPDSKIFLMNYYNLQEASQKGSVIHKRRRANTRYAYFVIFSSHPKVYITDSWNYQLKLFAVAEWKEQRLLGYRIHIILNYFLYVQKKKILLS